MADTVVLAPPHGDGVEQRERTPLFRPLRILLAEDNKINQQFATLILTKAGHSVEIAANGREAVEAVKGFEFDIVLMDIQMPELDGIEATREIRRLKGGRSQVPIVAVTAHAMAGAKEEYLAAGMSGYISKPFQPSLLLSTVLKVSSPETYSASALDASEPGTSTANFSDLPLLDLGQLSLFGSVFTLQKMRTLASLYMIDVEARLALIATCRSKSDFEGVSRQAHIIVSTAGNLGAKQTSAVARTLEIACATCDPLLCDPLADQLRLSCTASSAELGLWLKTPGANFPVRQAM